MIRRIEKDDLPQLIPLLQQLWPDVSLDSENIHISMDRYFENDNYEMYCYEDEKILGIVTLSKRYAFFYGGKVAIIEDLVVDEQNRGRGIGKQLVEFVEKELEREGIKGIELASDFHRADAHKFWERLGYMKSAHQFRKRLTQR